MAVPKLRDQARFPRKQLNIEGISWEGRGHIVGKPPRNSKSTAIRIGVVTPREYHSFHRIRGTAIQVMCPIPDIPRSKGRPRPRRRNPNPRQSPHLPRWNHGSGPRHDPQIRRPNDPRAAREALPHRQKRRGLTHRQHGVRHARRSERNVAGKRMVRRAAEHAVNTECSTFDGHAPTRPFPPSRVESRKQSLYLRSPALYAVSFWKLACWNLPFKTSAAGGIGRTCSC